MAATDWTGRQEGHHRGAVAPRADQVAPRAAWSAAALWPFPATADYAVLSNCHTGALVSPVRRLEGAVEVELACEPVFDHRRLPARWMPVEGRRHLDERLHTRRPHHYRSLDRGRPRAPLPHRRDRQPAEG